MVDTTTHEHEAAAKVGAEAGRKLGETIGAATGEAAAQIAEQTVGLLKSEAQAKADDLKNRARSIFQLAPEAGTRLSQLTRRYPLPVVGAAFAIGFRLARRRGSATYHPGD